MALKGHFGRKGYPLLGVFIQENDVFVYFSDEMGKKYLVSTVKLQKWGACLGIFSAKVGGMFSFFLKKVTHFSGTPPFTMHY